MINNAFWKYSIQRYAQNEIATLCLQWQNDFQSNTNLVLFGDWLGSQGTVLTQEQWQAINEFILPWHSEIVLPLRKVRTTLKSKVSNKYIYQLRDNVKMQELLAEQILQSQLYDYCQKHITINTMQADAVLSAKERIKKNIKMYLQACCGVKEINEADIMIFLQ